MLLLSPFPINPLSDKKWSLLWLTIFYIRFEIYIQQLSTIKVTISWHCKFNNGFASLKRTALAYQHVWKGFLAREEKLRVHGGIV